MSQTFRNHTDFLQLLSSTDKDALISKLKSKHNRNQKDDQFDSVEPENFIQDVIYYIHETILNITEVK